MFERTGLRFFATALLIAVSGVALAGDGSPASPVAIGMFVGLVLVTLLITRWAAGHTHTRSDFYVAHGRITPLQNSLAIAGEFISAGTLLGFTALFFSAGADAFIYVAGSLSALVLILFIVGQRLRNLGQYTFADILAARFSQRPVRLAASANTLVIMLLLMVGQMAGAGGMTEILFGIPYAYSVILCGTLMTAYVMFGGMYATTWVQIVKAAMLLVGGAVLSVLVLSRFKFSIDALLDAATRAHPKGLKLLAPGGLVHSAGDAASLVLTLALGSAGLPHLLMRFFTVKDGRAASRSVGYATVFIAFFYLLLAIFGFGAAALLLGNEAYAAPGGGLRGSDNMALLHLAQEIGGPVLFGAIAAIVFATSLAVMSGLCLSAATTVSHDLYAQTIRRGAAADDRREIMVSRMAVAVFSLIASVLAILVQGQNIIFMVALGVSIAASSNCPVLIAAMYWKGATTRGITAASLVGLLTSVVLIVLGPTIWVGVMHNDAPVFPFQYPTIVALPVTIAVLIAVSMLDRSGSRSTEQAVFDSLRLRALIGPE